MGLIESSVVRARVSHSRRQPVDNSFTYGIDYLLLDAKAIEQNQGPKLFSFGRPNLVSLRYSDHGVSSNFSLKYVRNLAIEAGISDANQVLLLTHPRYWGYTFNPVSFWFVFNKSDQLSAVLSEVHNTYGDRHAYFCTGIDRATIKGTSWLDINKEFHVSPFFDVEGKYRFRFQIEDMRLGVWINYDDGKGGGLYTSIIGNRLPFTDRELTQALLRRPFGAARTTALIHWQAFRLWRKGVGYRSRPEPPRHGITR